MITPLGCVVMVAVFLGVPYLTGRLERHKHKRKRNVSTNKGDIK